MRFRPLRRNRRVLALVASFGGSSDPLAPGAITLVGLSPTNDTTPPFTIGFPENVAEGWILVIDEITTPTEYISHTLTAQDIIDIGNEDPITLSGATPLSAGTRVFRGHLENGVHIGPDSDDETIVIDTTAPTVVTLTPADNATGVAIGANLTAEFSEDIEFDATVAITIKLTSDNSTVHAFDEDDIGVAISISGDTLTINPPSDLTAGIEYYVQIDATSIRDVAGTAFAGITTTTGWSFTTLSSATTLNPSDKAADCTLSGGNLIATHAVTGSGQAAVRSIASTSTAKRYWELTLSVVAVPSIMTQGFGNASSSLTTYFGDTANSVGWIGDGQVLLNNANIGPVATFADNDILSFAVDFNAKLAWFRVGAGNWNNSGAANPATGTGGLDISAIAAGPYHAGVGTRVDSDSVTANFGATAYANAAPSGFGNW